MKAIVFSDSHRNFSSILNALEKEKDIDLIIHAGDVHKDVEDILFGMPQIPCAYVLGNNDFFVMDEPSEREFTFGNKKIFLTHGHTYGVKGSLSRLKSEARRVGAEICIFGHTHSTYLENEDGIWYLNPGPTWKGYGIINITNDKIDIKIVEN